jgi:hypothetical protein
MQSLENDSYLGSFDCVYILKGGAGGRGVGLGTIKNIQKTIFLLGIILYLLNFVATFNLLPLFNALPLFSPRIMVLI